jgi:spermidine synthase/MFS family permease
MQIRPLPSALATALVFLASGAVLVLEIVALRLVGPYVGVTLQVSSSVIGISLGAIAYGTWLGGRLADRFDPRSLLAPALILAAIGTAVTLPLVRWGGEVLRGGTAPAILLLAAMAVFPPAFLLSGITPLVVKLQLGDLNRTGQVVGRLSSVGTLGAITATLGTGFVLVAAIPSSWIVLSLAGLLATVGASLAWWLRRQVRMPGQPRTRAILAAVGLVGAGLGAVTPTPCDIETAYHCARVDDDPAVPGGRVLILNSARHSYVDLNDPRHLEFAYVQWLGAVTDVLRPAGAPIDALHLGGGGFTVPEYVRATRPGSDQLVLELDGDLVRLDRAKLGLTTGPDLRVRVGDARVGLAAQRSAVYDFVVGDAFGYLVVPWHLATREMAVDIARVLRPDGVYAQNVIDYPPNRFIHAEVATVAAAFRYVALVAPQDALDGKVGSNFLIVASQQPLPLAALGTRMDRLKEPVRVLSGAELTAFVRHARVLTDDYAPVDQLLPG